MSVAKKIEAVSDDKINANIQRKFDLVFTDKAKAQRALSNESSDKRLGDPQNFNVDEMIMERNDGNKNKPKLDFDFTTELKTSVIPNKVEKPNAPKAGHNELDFSLDFDANLEKSGVATKTRMSLDESSKKDSSETPTESSQMNVDEGFTLDDSDIGDIDFRADATQKTILFNPSMLKQAASDSTSIDNMSNDEAKANIESTIKEIVRSELDTTMDFAQATSQTDISQIEDSVLDFENTPSKAFSLSDLGDDSFTLDSQSSAKKGNDNDFDSSVSKAHRSDATMDFNLSELTIDSLSEEKSKTKQSFEYVNEDEVDAPTRIAQLNYNQIPMPTPAKLVEVQIKAGIPVESVQNQKTQHESSNDLSSGPYNSGLNTEDSMRYHATIRALREEREEMLLQIKNLKGESKELEQDNLTLKANLDEAKIEISILRKRHMLEIEDLKYRVSLSDEKKALADEKAKLADNRREKLEQKVRIDFNQVKQREKELESKLELLSMDVDSQVHSRDQKILELRRKIDALEFNMENTSIKEQKSHEDKRKLEERLNKIMKTLRHSIKNLEDDIDHMVDDSDQQKDKN